MASASAVALDVSPLSLPTSIPKTHTITVVKNGPLGVTLRSKDCGIIILEVKPGSVLQNTGVEAGQILLTINGCAVHSVDQGVALISSTPDSQSITLFTSDAIHATGAKMAVFATSQTNPRLHFGSTRNGTLVKVARIFQAESMHKVKLNEGDVVMSVNGFAVTSPTDAMRALRLRKNQEATVIFALDCELFREKLIDRVRSMKASFGPIKISRQYDRLLDRDDLYSFYGDQRIPNGNGNFKVVTRVYFDKDTQRMMDPYPAMNLSLRGVAHFKYNVNWYSPKDIMRGDFTRLVIPFMKEYNQLSDDIFCRLEEVVCFEAWQFPIPSSSTTVALSSVSSVHSTSSIPVAEARMMSERGTSYV